jgi:hypothetical protein
MWNNKLRLNLLKKRSEHFWIQKQKSNESSC